jgi:hypothetical protein
MNKREIEEIDSLDKVQRISERMFKHSNKLNEYESIKFKNIVGQIN